MVPTDAISHIAGYQASSATETPVFPVCVCVTVPSSCVFTQVCLCHLCLHVFVYVCACVWPTSDAEMKVTEYETWRNKKRRLETSTGSGRLVNVSLWRPCPKQERGKDGQ